ncbi:hypothetical protein F5Y16DRAFT_304491 [Xylariaceae sp. FL0255]|nr:hypothetical protein F5Y16DRAFT_304491 [Xylariaceae sp. FL0255]
MATTFHPFPRLPKEIRLMIWNVAMEPRNVVIMEPFDAPRKHGIKPPPLAMNTCVETRSQYTAVKRKIPSLYELGIVDYYDGRPFVFPRYDLVNFAVDTIWLWATEFSHFEEYVNQMKFAMVCGFKPGDQIEPLFQNGEKLQEVTLWTREWWAEYRRDEFNEIGVKYGFRFETSKVPPHFLSFYNFKLKFVRPTRKPIFN